MQRTCEDNYITIPLQQYKRQLHKNKAKTKLNKLILFQRLLGLFLIALSIATTKLLLDITFAIIFVPLAIYLLVTKEIIIEL